MQQLVFLLPPNGVLVNNVHDLYCSDENGIIFILHVFAFIELNAYSIVVRPYLLYLNR